MPEYNPLPISIPLGQVHIPRTSLRGSTGVYRKGFGRSGDALVEFSLVGIVLLTLLLGFIDFSCSLFARSLLRYSVSQGVRYGITGRVRPDMSHAESIKAVVQENSLGLLTSPTHAATIKVRYYSPDGATETGVVRGNNLLEVAVEDYHLIQLAPLFWPELTITNRLVDVLEPFAGGAGGAGGGGGGECIASS